MSQRGITMRQLYFLIALLTVTMLSMTGESLSTMNMADMHQAESLLSEYFNMLENGNTSGVLNLLTGPMLKNNQNLLRNNSTYADFLRERYRNCSFLITKYKLIDTSKSVVDVVIMLDTREEISIRFTLLAERDRLKISAEEEISTVGGNKQ